MQATAAHIDYKLKFELLLEESTLKIAALTHEIQQLKK
jgi:hypothetical protein